MAKYNNDVPLNASSWWKDLHLLCFGDGPGAWMEEGLKRKLGEGNDVNFWFENWTGLGSFCDIYGRLFALSSQQNEVIKDMGSWSNGTRLWDLKWRRDILPREENMVEALRIQLSNFTPIEGTQDSWIWTKDEAGRFSVKSAYAVLQGEVREPIHRVYHKLWSLKAPSNVLSLA